MNRRLLAVLALTLLAPLIPCAVAGEEVPSREAIERDLVLEATLTTSRTIQPGEPVRVKSRIVNVSKTQTYRLVRPGDGSESGWREPRVFFDAETLGPRGQRTAVPEREIGRCGMYDANWHDDVITLEPGAVLDLHNWMPAAHHALDFQQEGPVEVRLHYHYTRGTGAVGGKALERPDGRGSMGDVPAFELVSKPVRLNVVRLLDIRLEVTGALEVGREARLSDVLQLHIANKATDPMAVSAQEVILIVSPFPRNSELFAHAKDIPASVERKSPRLASGATRTWSGRSAWKELTDWQLTPKQPGTLKVVAQWSKTGGGARYRSEPVLVSLRRP